MWERVRAEIATRPGGAGREMAWLADKLTCSIQRIKNWERRGVPTTAYQEIADALGWPIDVIAGRGAPPGDPWPFESISRAEFDALTERQKGMLELRMREAMRELSGEFGTPQSMRDRLAS